MAGEWSKLRLILLAAGGGVGAGFAMDDELLTNEMVNVLPMARDIADQVEALGNSGLGPGWVIAALVIVFMGSWLGKSIHLAVDRLLPDRSQKERVE